MRWVDGKGGEGVGLSRRSGYAPSVKLPTLALLQVSGKPFRQTSRAESRGGRRARTELSEPKDVNPRDVAGTGK